MGLVGLHQYLDRVEELLEAGQLEESLAHCLLTCTLEDHEVGEVDHGTDGDNLEGSIRIGFIQEEIDELVEGGQSQAPVN